MCEPATLAMIALGTMAAGTVVTAVGAIQQGNAARKQADFNSQVSRNNAVLATRQADDSLKRGRLRERQLRLKQSKQEGATRAAFSANNVRWSNFNHYHHPNLVLLIKLLLVKDLIDGKKHGI